MDFYGSDSDSEKLRKMPSLDLSYSNLDVRTMRLKLTQYEENRERPPKSIHAFLLNNNQLYDLPSNLSCFVNLRHLDLSNNRLRALPDYLTKFPLVSLSAKNNLITDENLPKCFFPWTATMTHLNLGGNNLEFFPMQVLDLTNLKYLYLGSNHIERIPSTINKLNRLSTLCLGGNDLMEVPETVGELANLEVLIVSDNNLESLPSSIAQLSHLKTLQLHKNRLRTLPTEIITLKCLSELSLRDNPLVVKFINDMTYNPASLLELTARCIKINEIPYDRTVLPGQLLYYLHSAHRCLNPKCNESGDPTIRDYSSPITFRSSDTLLLLALLTISTLASYQRTVLQSQIPSLWTMRCPVTCC